MPLKPMPLSVTRFREDGGEEWDYREDERGGAGVEPDQLEETDVVLVD